MFTNPRQDQGLPISDFNLLRCKCEEGGPSPPLVPALKSDTDTSYFDDFDDPEDMEMYKDVKDRQEALEKEVERKKKSETNPGTPLMRSAFIGFTFKHRGDNKNSSTSTLF